MRASTLRFHPLVLSTAIIVSMLATGGTLWASTSRAGAAGSDSVNGSATGVMATGLVTVDPTPTVTLPAVGSAQSQTETAVPTNTLITTGTLTVSTSATNAGSANEQVQSAASAENLVVAGLPGPLSVGALSSSCTANAAGSSGTSTVATLEVAGNPVTIPAGVNVNVSLPSPLNGLVNVVLNQQTQSDIAGISSMTVNALALTVLGSGQTLTVAQSFCKAAGPDIGNPPTVSSLLPTTGATNGGTPVTITGTGFVSPASVSFGGVAATDVTVVSPTRITANSPAHAAGTVPVSVSTPAGSASAPQQFSYVTIPVAGVSPPVVVGTSPTSGPPRGGGTVTIVGTNLCNVSAVFFGSTPASAVSSNASCTVLTVTVPPGSGSVPIVITTLGGTVTSADSYTYIQPGYWMVASDGGVFSFGGASYYGSMGGHPLNQPIVAMADTPDRGGYWLFAADGGVFAFGDARFYGSVPGVLAPQGRSLNAPIVAAEATSDGKGYRLFAADGGVFDFGDAQFVNSLPGLGIVPKKPITAATSSPFGQGYWLVAADGGVFSFGSAAFEGSTGAQALVAPMASMTSTADGNGYWLFATDGGVFTFGDAGYVGSMGGQRLNAPIVSGATPTSGTGYWLFATDGGVFSFGSAGFEGSLGAIHLNRPIVGGVGF